MILNCPACGTRYLIDPAVLGAGGRQVRCARCSDSWHQRPPEDMPKPLPPPITPDPSPRRTNLPAIRAPARRSAAPAWIALALIFATLGGVGIFARDSIVEAWPKTAYLYEIFDLDPKVPWEGLELRNVKTSNTTDGDLAVIVVTGQILNTTDHDMNVPELRAKILDRGLRELVSWTIMPEQADLAPGETTEFEGRSTERPKGADSLVVVFEGAG